jgi:putative peptidoglycan lipid II flippase
VDETEETTVVTEDAALTRSAGLIGSFTMLSRVLGMIRDMVVAAFFGAGMFTDAFFVAFSIPNILRRLVGEGSLTVSFVPIFTEYLKRHGREESLRLAHIAITLVVIALAGMTLLGIAIAEPLVKIMAPGFQDVPGKIELTVWLTQCMFPYTFFICLVALAMGILNSFRHFTAPALAPVLLNISMIACVLAFHDRFYYPDLSLVTGVLAGGILQLALQIPFLWKFGVRFKIILDMAHPALRRIGLLMLPSVFGIAVTQINILVSTIFISPFPGGRSFLYYADRMIELPVGVFAIALGTAILPTLSRFAADDDMNSLGKSLGYGMRLLAMVIIPSMVGLMILRVPIVNLIFERKEFSHNDSIATARTLLYFATGLWAFSWIRIIVPAYYSLKDARTPVIAGCIAMLVNIAGCIILPRYLQYAGIALSIAVAGMVNFAILIILIRKRLPSLDGIKILSALIKIIAACIPMGILIYPVTRIELWQDPGQVILKIIWMSASVAGGILVYIIFAWLLRLEELKALRGIIQDQISRKGMS